MHDNCVRVSCIDGPLLQLYDDKSNIWISFVADDEEPSVPPTMYINDDE